MDELLPIGSVVQLKNQSKLTVIGYLPSKPEDEVFYEYVGCPYKLGIRHAKERIRKDEDLVFFQKEDIQTVLFLGYQNREFDLFQDYYSKVEKLILSSREQKIPLNQEELDKIYLTSFERVIKNGRDQNEK